MWCWGCWIANGWKWPSWAARPTKEFRTSITRTKSMGDSGSPCRSPRRWIILSLGSPFSSILVDEYEQDYCRRHSKWRQPCPKPIWMRTSRRKNQDTESKAFDMSNLRSLATVQLFSHLLHKHKVVLYVSLLHKSWLVCRDQFGEERGQTISHHLGHRFGKTVDEADWSEII